MPLFHTFVEKARDRAFRSSPDLKWLPQKGDLVWVPVTERSSFKAAYGRVIMVNMPYAIVLAETGQAKAFIKLYLRKVGMIWSLAIRLHEKT